MRSRIRWGAKRAIRSTCGGTGPAIRCGTCCARRSRARGGCASASLVAGAGDAAAAAPARLSLESGLLGGGVVFAADGAPAPAGEPGEAVELIIERVRQRENGGASLEAFRRNVEAVRLGHCIV